MIKGSFLDNQVVGADDLNGLVQLLMSPGLADAFQERDDVFKFEHGMPYNVSALNGAVYSNLSSGYLPDTNNALKVSVENGVATVESGKAIFPHGQVAEVINNESVQIIAGEDCYIVLDCNESENRVVLSAIQAMPGTDNNMVVLAKVAADGTVTDLRTYAKGKAPSMYAADTGLAGRRVFSLDYNTDSLSFSSNSAGYNYMFVMGKCKQSGTRKNVLACVDLNSMAAISAANRFGNADGDNQKFYVRADGTFIAAYTQANGINYELFGKVSVSDGTFTIAFTKQSYAGESDWNSYVFPAEIEIVLV